MRARDVLKAMAAMALLSLSVGMTAARAQDTQQTGDPVADAARKAREAKKETPKPKKVYTDDDVKPAVPEPAAATGAATAPVDGNGSVGAAAMNGLQSVKAEATQKTEQKKPADDPNSEASWRKKFADQRDKIAKAEKELDVYNRELQKAQVEYYPDPQKALTQQNTRGDINDLTAKIDAKKKELEQLRQGLDDMEDQLRKSGGDPGWAR
jgi:DNA repair exonuclease SbcCD ATPase subunit